MELVGLILLYGLVATVRCCTELTHFFSCGGACRRFCSSRDNDDVISGDEIDDDGGGEELTADDIAAVLTRLGIGYGDGGGEGRRVVGQLLEEKEASEWELKEAFYVFDRNEDGFITVDELWNVMRRLGFEEGRRVEDCERMIRVFDEDGDGKISFLEFRRLLEDSI
ncbi:calmodulin-like protein 3 [Phalaenopsis equestris]|uniref:calmodulin-like protein 3 n=1 Tax=Phalaenopsis equestris TaxID=78828 RepID=UPI0009E2FBB2|nr:calmodulin-like protein 3 [Phalaenopsis equestris]